ncbi:uncharacterized protein RHO25_011056 [Cercospora beticola]|uniref:BZIP domain-containing protein n=2 Tax=Cercospora beticola TaxID=122368 RepID=A0ABZ0P3G8_CERBT|nr:hypothetical protein RHO25_011056 [Cercospora beticola]
MVSATPLDYEAATALLSARAAARPRVDTYRYMADMAGANQQVQFQQALQLQDDFTESQADLDYLQNNQVIGNDQMMWNNEYPFGQPQEDVDDSWAYMPQATQPMLLPPQIQQHENYINYEAQQHHQQVAAPGFRAYDQPSRSTSVKHERVDSVGSNGVGNKVAIPKNGSISSLKRKASDELSPTQSGDAGMTAQRSGPMSTDITIPARPRPGRKPLGQENAADRRRVQNRVAQRNFRDKRAQKNQQLEDQIRELSAAGQQREAENRNTIAHLRTLNAEKDRALADLKAEVAALRTEITEKDKRIADLDSNLKARVSVEQVRSQPGQTALHEPSTGPTPPSSEYEIDFTTYGRSTSSAYAIRDVLNENNDVEFTIDNEDPCGFCTDEQNCACKQEQQRQRSKPVPMEPKVTTMPGSCDMCRSDPERARACREMAAATRPASGETPRSFANQPSISTLSSSTSMPPPRMSCSAMLDQFNKYGQRTSTIRDLFGGRPLNAYPRESGGGFDLEEKQAAEVLSTLARRSTGAESTSSFASSQ